MAQEIVVQVRKGVPYRIEEVDVVDNNADAHVVTGDDKKLRVSVKRVEGSNRVSSKVVDITMCG